MEEDDSQLYVFEDARHPLLPSWVVTCFMINVIMGSGFLGVPSGFLSSGMLLGPLVLLAVTALQWVAACQLAQVAARSHALLTDVTAAHQLTPTLAPLAKFDNAAQRSKRPSPPSLGLPSNTSYEVMMLCRLHLGRWSERCVMVSVMLYMVRAQSRASHACSATVAHGLRVASQPLPVFRSARSGASSPCSRRR